MKISTIPLILRKAPFQAGTTIVSFVLFIGILFLTAKSIEPNYFMSLIFAVPFVSFGIITLFTITGKLKIVTSSLITGILIFVLGFAMLYAFVYTAFKTGTTVTTDISKYERVLKLTGYPKNPLIKHFPDRIPSNAKNIIFSYNPAFLQGGERFVLKFETDLDSIKNYINEFSQKAKWTGKSKDSEAEKNGIFSGIFGILGYMDLSEDFTIYLIDSKPYQLNNWNHGKLNLVAISRQQNMIIFFAEDW